jgi:hypothetical protein
MKEIKPKKIEVRWNDTFSNQGWWDESDIKEKLSNMPYLNTTTGYLVGETKDWLILAMSYEPKSNVWGCIKHIPKGCIVSKTIIR